MKIGSLHVLTGSYKLPLDKFTNRKEKFDLAELIKNINDFNSKIIDIKDSTEYINIIARIVFEELQDVEEINKFMEGGSITEKFDWLRWGGTYLYSKIDLKDFEKDLYNLLKISWKGQYTIEISSHFYGENVRKEIKQYVDPYGCSEIT